MTSPPNPLNQFRIISHKCSLCPFTKIVQMVLLHWTRWLPELKIEKSSNDISSLASSPISEYLHRSVSLMARYQICWNDFPWLNKMATRAKNRKTFKWHLLCGQWPDFKVISQKCSSWPFTKIAKMVPLGWTKGPPILNIEKPLNDISYLASGPISKWFHRKVPLIPLYQNC